MTCSMESVPSSQKTFPTHVNAAMDSWWQNSGAVLAKGGPGGGEGRLGLNKKIGRGC